MIKEYIIKIDEDQSKKDIHGSYPLIEPPLELIRCKDCWKHDYDNCPFNEYWGVKTPDDWWCADGRPKNVCFACANACIDEEDSVVCSLDGKVKEGAHTCEHWS